MCTRLCTRVCLLERELGLVRGTHECWVSTISNPPLFLFLSSPKLFRLALGSFCSSSNPRASNPPASASCVAGIIGLVLCPLLTYATEPKDRKEVPLPPGKICPCFQGKHGISLCLLAHLCLCKGCRQTRITQMVTEYSVLV